MTMDIFEFEFVDVITKTAKYDNRVRKCSLD